MHANGHQHTNGHQQKSARVGDQPKLVSTQALPSHEAPQPSGPEARILSSICPSIRSNLARPCPNQPQTHPTRFDAMGYIPTHHNQLASLAHINLENQSTIKKSSHAIRKSFRDQKNKKVSSPGGARPRRQLVILTSRISTMLPAISAIRRAGMRVLVLAPYRA